MIKVINIDIHSNEFLDTPTDLALCLGFFDGVHLGHQALIEAAKNLSSNVGVLTLDRSPKETLEGKSEPSLSSTYDKKEILETLGVNYLFILEFDNDCALLSKDEFIHKIIDRINPYHIFVGEDYRFGFRASGDPAFLSLFYPTSIIPLVYTEGEKVSSSKIISLIKEGEVDKAYPLLSRPYFISGVVVNGLGNGAKNEIPTANVKPDFNYVIPSNGVYATYAYIGESKAKRKSLTCISTHPTIQELEKPIIETYIFDFNENIYGKSLKVEFIKKIRDIYTFSSMEELKKQIQEDEKESKKYL